MKKLFVELTEYEVANLFVAVDFLLEHFEDDTQPSPSAVQYQTLHDLAELLGQAARAYFGYSSALFLPLIFDPVDESLASEEKSNEV